MNYHIRRLVLSSFCVGSFVAAGIWWYSFCRLKPANEYFQIYIYIIDRNVLENCNLLLKIILLMSLAIKKIKILFCNIVVKHSILKKFGLLCWVFR